YVDAYGRCLDIRVRVADGSVNPPVRAVIRYTNIVAAIHPAGANSPDTGEEASPLWVLWVVGLRQECLAPTRLPLDLIRPGVNAVDAPRRGEHRVANRPPGAITSPLRLEPPASCLVHRDLGHGRPSWAPRGDVAGAQISSDAAEKAGP